MLELGITELLAVFSLTFSSAGKWPFIASIWVKYCMLSNIQSTSALVQTSTMLAMG